MTAPDYVGLGLAPELPPGVRPSRLRRARHRAGRWGRAVAAWLYRPARLLPALAAVACAVAGAWVLWGVGWALLAAVPFLLAIDARTPRA